LVGESNAKATKIAIENAVGPGRTRQVDAAKYEALKITSTKSLGKGAQDDRTCLPAGVGIAASLCG
jgi:hypothetical protein